MHPEGSLHLLASYLLPQLTAWGEVVRLIRAFVNDSGELGYVAEDADGSFGAVALYAGGTGEVRFKDVAYKDLGLHEIAPEQISNNFRKQQISDF